MENKIFELSAWEKNSRVVMFAVQGEALSRTITVKLLGNCGQPIDVTQASVRLYIIKPDKTKIYKDGIISDAQNGLVNFLLDSQAVVAAGTAQCYVTVTQTDGGTLIFTGMSLIISPAYFDGCIESTNEFTALQTALAKVQDIDNRVLKTTTVNNHALTENIVLTPADLNAATAAQGAKADSAVQSSEKAIANGVATLDGNKKLVQMPTAADVGAKSGFVWDTLATGAHNFTALDTAMNVFLTFPSGVKMTDYMLILFSAGSFGNAEGVDVYTIPTGQNKWYGFVADGYRCGGSFYCNPTVGKITFNVHVCVGWQPTQIGVGTIYGLRLI